MVLAWLAAAWLAGIAASARYGDDAWPIALTAAATALTIALARRSLSIALYAIVLPAVILGGMLREGASHSGLPDNAVAHFNDGAAMRIRGVLRDDPQIGDTSQRFAVSVREVQRAGQWHEASGGVLVRGPLLPSYRAGDVVEIEGKLASPPALDGFDYADYLARQRIQSVMAYPSIRMIGHDEPSFARASVLRVRRSLSHALAVSLAEPQASLAQGVLLGERSALPPDLNEQLNATNTSHLVVVSGSNVVIVSSFFAMLFGWLTGRRWALVLSIAAIGVYMVLIGMSPPVVRASVMGVLLVIARTSGRRSSGITALLAAAAVMAGFTPSILRDVSFQLTFAATAGIMYLAAPLQRRSIDAIGWLLRRDDVPRPIGWLLAEPAAVTVAATIATAPLLAYYFGRASLVGLPANMVIVPAFPLILASTALAAAGGLIPGLHLAFSAPAHFALSYWIGVAGWFASLPGATVGVGNYSAGLLAATYVSIAATLLVAGRVMPRGTMRHLAESRPFSWRAAVRRTMLVAPVVGLAGAGFVALPSPEPRLEVTVLDVGQGDAILIETPSGADVLVDAGPGRAVLRGLGRQLPWHDRSIDLAIVTHGQADHATGMLDVLDRYDVSRVIAGGDDGRSVLRSALSNAAAREGITVESATDSSFDLGDGVRLTIIVRGDDAAPLDGNDASAVVLLTYGDVSFLLTGDIEAAAGRVLLDAGIDLRATVLKVAHHGSRTSSTRAFLDAVAPQVSVVSAGADNRFGHPAREVVDRLDDYGAVYNTAKSGDVRLSTDGERLWIETGR
jgi:competence protein ComEC